SRVRQSQLMSIENFMTGTFGLPHFGSAPSVRSSSTLMTSEGSPSHVTGQVAEQRRYGLRFAYSEPTSIPSTLFRLLIRFTGALCPAFPARSAHRRWAE